MRGYTAEAYLELGFMYGYSKSELPSLVCLGLGLQGGVGVPRAFRKDSSAVYKVSIETFTCWECDRIVSVEASRGFRG